MPRDLAAFYFSGGLLEMAWIVDSALLGWQSSDLSALGRAILLSLWECGKYADDYGLDFALKARDVFLDDSLSWRFRCQGSRSRSSAALIRSETKRAS